MKNFKLEFIKKILFIFLMIIIFVSFVLSYTIGLGNDEFFTIGLIKHSYLNLININALDVHPPLYYLVLKLFLQITTFWTNSVIIKILFARLLSLIFFTLTFIILVKLLKLCSFHISSFILFIIYFSYVSIASCSITIRMYQMDTFLLALELYELFLLKYMNKDKIKHSLIILIVVALSFYTNYFSALFAGSFLLVDFISYLSKRHFRQAKYILIIGILDALLFVPCLKYTFNQINYVSHNSYSNFVGVSKIGRNIYTQLLGAFTDRNINDLKSLIFAILFAIIEIIIIIYIHQNNMNDRLEEMINYLYCSFIIGFIPSILFSYISHPMIQSRYGSPLFNIILFFLMAIAIYWISTLSYENFVCIIALLFFVISGLKSCKFNYHNDVNDYNTIESVIKFQRSNSDKIVLNTTNSTQILRPLYYSVYLTNTSHKEIIAKHMSIKNILASNNIGLIKKTYPNIKLEGKLGKTYQ